MGEFLVAIGILGLWAFLALRSLPLNQAKANSHPVTLTLIAQRFMQILHRLGRLPSLLFILVYLGVIVGFAVIYASLPARHFFHATAMYEFGPMTDEARDVMRQLKTNIRDGFVSYYGQSAISIDGWILDVDQFSINAIDVADFPEKVTFKIYVPLELVQDGETQMMSYEPSSISVSLLQKAGTIGYVFLFPEVEESAPQRVEGLPSPPSLDSFLRSGQFGGDTPILVLPNSLYSRIVALGEGYRGFPTAIRGHWARMLYFSAGIGTSNAFGDIVPVTSLARTLVTLEALAALVLVSLFLNSLGHLVASDRQPNSHVEEQTQ